MMSAVLTDEQPIAVLTAPILDDQSPGDDSSNRETVDSHTAPAFSTLIERFGDEIYRFAWHLTRNQADADDLYQETLFKSYRAYSRLPADANHRAWLYRIASNTFISDRRKRSRDCVLTEVVEQTATHGAPDHARSLDARDLLGEVQNFVQALPPKQRVALIMRKYQGADYGQIASALECSEVAARANVHEALRKLRTQFAHRLDY